VLDCRRVPLSPAGGVMRALVPIPLGTAPGDHTLGFEIAGRRGVQRVPLTIGIVPRSYPPRAAVLPLAKHALVASPEALRDGRRVLLALRATELGPLATGPLRPPVGGVAGTGFGGLQTYAGIDRAVELLKDALFGEQHRGLDYDVPVGTAVTSPAAGRVLLAGWLAATGWTVLVDHGAGLVSALFHLSAVSVREGDLVFGGGPLGRSGEAGLASHPHVHWGVYLHGVAVDPAVVMQGFES
jgi:murein DD-endopeptidase MepM/ murein hydrolase activator NlpD